MIVGNILAIGVRSNDTFFADYCCKEMVSSALCALEDMLPILDSQCGHLAPWWVFAQYHHGLGCVYRRVTTTDCWQRRAPASWVSLQKIVLSFFLSFLSINTLVAVADSSSGTCY